MNRLLKGILIGLTVISTVAVIYLGFDKVHKEEGKKTAKEAVMLMYDFDSYDNVYKEHMASLKKITTDEIYNNITVENIDRALTTYLKFKGHPSKVEFIEVTDNYVVYSLDTESITQTRKFAMFYHTNWLGKIDSMKEAELRDFYKASTSRSDD